jgi:hypothetical protein
MLVMIAIGSFTNPIKEFESFKDEHIQTLDDTALFDNNEDTGIADVELADGAKQEVTTNTEIVDSFLGGVGLDNKSAQKFTNGVLSTFVVNTEGSGNIIYGILNSINQLVFKDKIIPGIIITIGAIIYVLICIFVLNVLFVGFYRYLLESRVYTKTKPNRILFAWSVKKDLHIAWVMFVMNVYSTLWFFTIIGGFIKSYSYKMVPMILAENPTMSANEAITLSRQMMNGNKWKAFLIDVSLLGWKFLNLLTFALLNIFFLQPYTSLINVELYMNLREEAKLKNIPNADKLCDTFLDAAPVSGKYPTENYLLPTLKSRRWIESDYNRNYSISSLILIFFTFSFIGWLWEVSLHLFMDGTFINRGVSHGPWLPIYGFGGVIVLVVLKKLRSRPVLTFIAAMVLCGILEYCTAWYLEASKGMKWWDYSGYFLNLNGRICLEGLFVFALGGCAAIYLIAPALDNLFRKIPVKTKRIICAVLVAAFIGDQIYSVFIPNSGTGITDYE